MHPDFRNVIRSGNDKGAVDIPNFVPGSIRKFVFVISPDGGKVTLITNSQLMCTLKSGWRVTGIPQKKDVGLIVFVGNQDLIIPVLNRFHIAYKFFKTVFPGIRISLGIVDIILVEVTGELKCVNSK